MSRKPKLGVFKFASCDGCQLSLLSVEDELLHIAGAIDIAYFLEATSRMDPGPYDIALVEGSITTEHDRQRIQSIRNDSKFLVTIGACATSGGIQALRNGADCAEFVNAIYATPDFISTLDTSTAIADHVKVDFELRGCPISQQQLLEVIRSLLAGRRPRIPAHSVCLDCKRRGTVCVMVSRNTPCLGPITQSGCHAICPTFNRGCYGCFGPVGQANLVSLGNHVLDNQAQRDQVIADLRSFNAAAPEFQAEARRLQDAGREQRP